MKRWAKLRVCASCRWVFNTDTSEICGCPKCGFGSYGARWALGDKCYTYKHTQELWMKSMLWKYECKLRKEIGPAASTDPRKLKSKFHLKI